MADLADDLQRYLDENRSKLSITEIEALEESIKNLRKAPGVRFTNADKFDAKDMVPIGQDHPVDWNPKKNEANWLSRLKIDSQGPFWAQPSAMPWVFRSSSCAPSTPSARSLDGMGSGDTCNIGNETVRVSPLTRMTRKWPSSS